MIGKSPEHVCRECMDALEARAAAMADVLRDPVAAIDRGLREAADAYAKDMAAHEFVRVFPRIR